MQVPEDLKYTKTHEWVKVDEDGVVVGITDFAQHQLSDLTFVELPAVDRDVDMEEEVAVVESVKAASDIYAPLGGRIAEINDRLNDEPELVNNDPYGEGWLFKLSMVNQGDIDQLMNADDYRRLIPGDDH